MRIGWLIVCGSMLALHGAGAQAQRSDPYEGMTALERAQAAYDNADYDTAVGAVDEVLAGDDAAEQLTARRLECRMFVDGGFYGAADKLLDEAIAAARKAKRPEAPLLVERGELRWREGRFDDAEGDLAAAIDGLRTTDNSRDLARANVVAARLLIDRGNPELAVQYADDAIEYLDRVEGEHTVDAAEARAVKAMIARAHGDVAHAQDELEAAVDSTAARLGRTHPRTLDLVVELAAVDTDLGNIGAAERALEETLDRLEELFQDTVVLGRPALELARLYASIGDLHGAAAAAKYAHDVTADLPLDHPLAIEAVLRHAETLAAVGAAQDQDFFTKLARAVAAGTPAEFRLHMVAALSAYAQGDGASAAAQLDALEGVKAPLPGDHAEVAWLRGRLAMATDHAAEAIRPFTVAAQELEAYAPGSPRRATMLFELGRAQVAAGDVEAALATWAPAAELRDQGFAALGRATDPSKRIYAWGAAAEMGVILEAVLTKAPRDAAAAKLAATLVVRRKGLVLELESAYLAKVRRKANSSELQFFESIRATTATYAAHALLGDGEAARWTERLNDLRDGLSRRATSDGKADALLDVAAIAAALPDGAVAVDLVGYADRYAAVVIHGDADVDLVDLGAQAELDADATAFRALLRDPQSTIADVRTAGRTLWTRLWKPIPGLGGARRVLVSGDGALNLVPFAAMVDDAGHYLIETTSISYLASSRDVLDFGARGTARSPAMLIGAPAFGEPPASPLVGDLLGEYEFTALPGTADEVAAIAALLPKARTLVTASATEGDVAHVEAPEILHLATHGFFLAADGTVAGDTRGVKRRKKPGQADDEPAPELDPLLRSGLALAGANLRELDGDQDGLVTAAELATIDLFGTKLVVMSACETGMGEASVGDGVFGLRRAVSIAGAQTQVMTLWMISDTVTRDLMIAYYQNLAGGQGRADAMQRAQLALLSRGATAHPYFWASFLVAGDPSNLDGRPTLPPGAHARGCGCQTSGGGGDALLVLVVMVVSLRTRRGTRRRRRRG